MAKEKITVLSGAGVSAESGIKTFRDAGGLWEGHDLMSVASPAGWAKNPHLVLDFYNQRRRQLKEVAPNAAHYAIKQLEEAYEVVVVTQNVDDLHERAGSTKVIHLHGELRKVRSTGKPDLVYQWEEDCVWGDTCEEGHQLRPHIVWFGEDVPAIHDAAREVSDAHHLIIIGTSMQVYPAAGLVSFAAPDAKIYYIDPKPSINYELSRLSNLEVIAKPATVGMQELVKRLLP
ncbi:MAG: NAD-dependent deacylase [Bacteroidetes bacterium]|nr:MAG: NAD-dependent deacylase [Bacteroidota bacterium]